MQIEQGALKRENKHLESISLVFQNHRVEKLLKTLDFIESLKVV